MSSFGIKTTPVSTAKGIQRKRMKKDQDLKALDQQIQTAERQVMSREMTPSEFKILVSKLQNRKVKIIREYAQKVTR